GRPTTGLFDKLAIARHPEAMAHQGKYPTIFFNFKDVEGASLEAFETKLRGKLAALVKQYLYLLNSPRVVESDRKVLNALLREKAGLERMTDAFRLLSELLYRHHDQKAIVLLDGYDAPIYAAYVNGFYKELIDFMRPALGAVLKDNRYLHKAVL